VTSKPPPKTHSFSMGELELSCGSALDPLVSSRLTRIQKRSPSPPSPPSRAAYFSHSQCNRPSPRRQHLTLRWPRSEARLRQPPPAGPTPNSGDGSPRPTDPVLGNPEEDRVLVGRLQDVDPDSQTPLMSSAPQRHRNESSIDRETVPHPQLHPNRVRTWPRPNPRRYAGQGTPTR
jgi:hypothetical protein